MYIAGSGPGALGMLTLRALDALKIADVVVYDNLISKRALAYARSDAELVYVGKSGSEHTIEQTAINELLYEYAAQGRVVLRFKGGDPLIFGRGSEEAQYLFERGIACEIIPGIPAAIGAAATAGIPLTCRTHASSVVFVTGHEDPSKDHSTIDWHAIARTGGTIVIYMGVKKASSVVAAIMEGGLAPDTKAAIVSNATLPLQTTVLCTLSSIPDVISSRDIKPPALIIIGETVSHSESLGWFSRRPLSGRKIVVTRPRAQNEYVTAKLLELGAEVIEAPSIEIVPLPAGSRLDMAIGEIAEYDWLVFTSVNGVDHFFARLAANGKDARSLASLRIAVIGPATAERLSAYCIIPDFQPECYIAESVFAGLDAIGEVVGKRYLLPRSEMARPDLPMLLAGAGATVSDIPVYATRPAPVDDAADDLIRDLICSGALDGVTFTSSSTVKCFIERIGPAFIDQYKDTIPAFSIGPVTTETLHRFGLVPRAEACEYTIQGLVAAMDRYFSGAAVMKGEHG